MLNVFEEEACNDRLLKYKGPVYRHKSSGVSIQLVADKILVVDDDEATCHFMEMMFKSEGYETESVHSAKEAIRMVRETRFNLIILDNRLPDIEGIDLLSQFHEIRPDLQVIIITGSSSLELAKLAIDSGAASFIVKPLDLREILPKVDEVLRKQRLDSEKK
ncbi:MAG: response regulator [Candidatus Thorarchaeota archaeon]|nr:MAG: response regulator [Candidatus Thorarchaeota archaeon]